MITAMKKNNANPGAQREMRHCISNEAVNEGHSWAGTEQRVEGYTYVSMDESCQFERKSFSSTSSSKHRP